MPSEKLSKEFYFCFDNILFSLVIFKCPTLMCQSVSCQFFDKSVFNHQYILSFFYSIGIYWASLHKLKTLWRCWTIQILPRNHKNGLSCRKMKPIHLQPKLYKYERKMVMHLKVMVLMMMLKITNKNADGDEDSKIQ